MVINGANYVSATGGRNPASIDLHLSEERLKCLSGNTVLRYGKAVEYHELADYVVPPRSFVLASTKEYLTVPAGVSGFVEGKSTIGRMGLFIHNAGFVDPGFRGYLTLELFNATNVPWALTPDQPICQIVFMQCSDECGVYNGRYQNQVGVQGAR